jgi:hypothetical protein
MLSKCLNPRCSAKFQYLWQGRLFRIDFSETKKKWAQAGKKMVASTRSKASPVEHFWLCGSCSATMTIGLTEAGEVRLVPFEIAVQKPTPESVLPMRKFVASAS